MSVILEIQFIVGVIWRRMAPVLEDMIVAMLKFFQVQDSYLGATLLFSSIILVVAFSVRVMLELYKNFRVVDCFSDVTYAGIAKSKPSPDNPADNTILNHLRKSKSQKVDNYKLTDLKKYCKD